MRGTGSLVIDMLNDPLPLLGKALSELRRAPDSQQLFHIAR
jgi:hypothetical protein